MPSNRVSFGKPQTITKAMLDHELNTVEQEKFAVLMEESREGFVTKNFYIRGTSAYMLYDPWASFSGVYGRFDESYHRDYRWIKVTEKCLHFYKLFLKDHQPHNLREAERLIHG